MTVVVHTPIWVWALYALLLFLGFQRVRDSIVPLWHMLILPITVVLLTLFGLIGAGVSGLPAVLDGTVAGSVAGWWLGRKDLIRRQADGRVRLPGDWWSFWQIVMVLIFRYATSVVAVMNPTVGTNFMWGAAVLAISAGVSGMFLGRAAARLRAYVAGIHGPYSTPLPGRFVGSSWPCQDCAKAASVEPPRGSAACASQPLTCSGSR